MELPSSSPGPREVSSPCSLQGQGRPLFPIHFFCLVLLGGLLGLDLDFGSPVPSLSVLMPCQCPFPAACWETPFWEGRNAIDAGEIVGPQKAGSSVGSRNSPVHFPAASCSNFSE